MAKSNKSASQSTREQVDTTRANASQQANSQTQSQPKSVSFIAAAAAMYRQEKSTPQAPYKASEEHQKVFAQAQSAVAEKMGITPNQDGGFDKKYLDKELSPEEVLKTLVFEKYKETYDNAKSYEEINKEIQSVYENDENPKATPLTISGMNNSLQNITFYNDADFMALSNEEKQSYLEKISDYGYEKDRLTQMMLADPNLDEQKSGEIKRLTKDPAKAPPVDDEDTKSKKGDIIEYIMEEIIMKGVDYMVNKTGNLAGLIIYDTLDVTWDATKNLIVKPVWNKGVIPLYNNTLKKPVDYIKETTKKGLKKAKQIITAPGRKFRDWLYSDERGSANAGGGKTIFELISDGYKVEHDRAKKNLETRDKFPSDQVEKILKDTVTHSSFIAPGEAGDELRNMQKIADAHVAALVIKNIGAENDPEKSSVILKYLKEHNAYRDAQAAGDKSAKKPQTPEKLKGIDMQSETTKAENEYLVLTKAIEMQNRMQSETDLFATNYAQYKIIEALRTAKTDEEKSNLENKDYIVKLLESYEAEGKMMMYENYQRLQKGDKEAMASSEMIALSEQMVENSERLYKNRDSETDSPNMVEEKLKPKKEATPENMADFTDKQTIDSLHKIEKNNLEREEIALNGMKENVDKRRNSLEERKKRLFSNEKFAEKNKVNTNIVVKNNTGPTR